MLDKISENNKVQISRLKEITEEEKLNFDILQKLLEIESKYKFRMKKNGINNEIAELFKDK